MKKYNDINNKDFWIEKALKYYELKKYRDVISACNRALQIDKTFTRAHLGRATAFYNLYSMDEAMIAVQQAIECNPDNVKAYILRSHIYQKQNKNIKALEDYIKALQLDPTNPQALAKKNEIELHQIELDKRNVITKCILQGKTCYEQKKYDDALTFYNQALEINPESRDALLGKARTLFGLKRYIESNNIYKEFQDVRSHPITIPYSTDLKESTRPDFFKW